MTKNPILNALAASTYIVALSLLMSQATQQAPEEDTVFAPIAVLSLFTLSAAVMAYLFLYTPFMLYFDNKRKAAVNLFLQTTLIFAALTAVTVILMTFL